MNFKHVKIVALAGMLLGGYACSIDDVKPLNQLTEDNVVSNEATAANMLNGVYNKYRDIDSKIAAALSYYGIETSRIRGVYYDAGFEANNVLDDNSIILDQYRDHYTIVNYANFLIEQLEAGKAKGLDEDRKKEMIGEAKYFRAYSHFTLLKTFGQFYDPSSKYGVVVSTKPIRRSISPARKSVRDTYNSIISDLNDAVKGIRNRDRRHFYLSKTTAKALLAKVQLYVGDYAAAATNALAVINDAADAYELTGNYADIFVGANGRWGREVLFALYVNGSTEYSMRTTYDNSTTSVYKMSSYFKEIADLSDGTKDLKDDASGAPTSGYDKRILYTYSKATRGANRNGKYPYSLFGAGNGNTFYYLRMAEVYLIYAEAEARKSGGVLAEALKRLNQVRTRAGMPVKTLSDKATLLADIRKEKMLELHSENAEPYYDAVRYHVAGDFDVTQKKSTLTENKFIFPIPVAALAGNPSLVQNPGY